MRVATRNGVGGITIEGKWFKMKNPQKFKQWVAYQVKTNVMKQAMRASIGYSIYKIFGDDEKGDVANVYDYEFGKNQWWHGDVDTTPIFRSMDKALGLDLPENEQNMVQSFFGPSIDPDDPNKKIYTKLGKQHNEILRAFSMFGGEWKGSADYILAKLNPVIQTSWEVATGESTTGFPQHHEGDSMLETGANKALHVLKKFGPISFSGNNFAFTLPSGGGMSDTKAIPYYEEGLKVYASPNRWDEMGITPETRPKVIGGKGRDYPEFINTEVSDKNLKALFSDITDALEDNEPGQSDKAFQTAKGNARKEFSGKAWRTLVEDDEIDEDALIALVRLGSNSTTMRASWNSHLKNNLRKDNSVNRAKFDRLIRKFAKIRSEIIYENR